MLTKNEVQENWQKGGQETDEASELIYISESHLRSVLHIHPTENQKISDTIFWNELSPTGRLSLLSYVVAKR